MKNITAVTIQSALEMVGFIKSNGTECRFVAMLSHTPVVKIRVGNPFGQVIKKGKVEGECQLFKVSRKIGIINANYNTSVRNRIAAALGVKVSDVEYENGEVWYQHLTTVDGKALPLVVNKATPDNGEFYLQYYPHKSTSAYVNAKGEVVPDEMVKPWLHKETEREAFKPSVIAIKVSNIKELRASGVIMQAEDMDAVAEALA